MCRPLPPHSHLLSHLSLKMKANHLGHRTAGIFLGGSEGVTGVCYIPRSMDGMAPITEEAAGLGDPVRLPEVAF